MARLEDSLNRLTDVDAGWWPWLALRPARQERMDARRVGRMAVYYGVPMGALVYACYVWIAFLPLSLPWALGCVLASIGFLFVGYRCTFAVAWNRRADRLRGGAGEAAG